ncbi:hypothetical protein GCM10017688_32360 [Streptomyces ramulosus]
MIASIESGKDSAGLIRYLFDTEKTKNHTNPRVVASWDGFVPDPGRADDAATARKLLVAELDLYVKRARRLGRACRHHVWHCLIRAASDDPLLDDNAWASIARRVTSATGIAPEDDPDGCRWVAVRHASGHIHIAATRFRADLRVAQHGNDYLSADRELATIEKEYGLRQLIRRDRAPAGRSLRADQEIARLVGRRQTARERLRTVIRAELAAASSTKEFIHQLNHTESLLVEVQYFPSGDIRSYRVALAEGNSTAGRPIWFSGSQLAPDLSFPKIQKRFANIRPHSSD